MQHTRYIECVNSQFIPSITLVDTLQFCNGMKLNLVLPPGPRDYWNELAAEHKNVPDHQKWEYEADPFTARKGVDERQEKATKRREEKGKGPDATATTSTEFSNAPEAKMAGSLRDLVEEAIKKVSLDSEMHRRELRLKNIL